MPSILTLPSMRTLWLITIIVAALSVERTAFADESARPNPNDEIAKPNVAEARAHLAKGTRHYRLREFEKAIEAYKAGVLIEDAAVFYYNLGQCYRQLGHPEDAIWHYQRFLDRANPLPPKYKEAAEDFIRAMKDALAKRAVAKPREPVPALSTLDIKAPRAITIVDPSEPWYADGFAWGLMGTGGLATGVAIWLLVDANHLSAQANASSSQQTQNALRDRASQRRLAGVIVGVAGGLTLITGVVKLAIAPSPRTRVVNASSVDLVLTPGGFAIAGRF